MIMVARKLVKNKAVIGLDIGGSAIKSALVSDSGKIFSEYKISTKSARSPKDMVDLVASAVRELAAHVKYKSIAGVNEIAAVGIGMPGPLDPENGIVFFTPNLPFKKQFNFAKAVKAKIKLPVFIQNDANAAALGEYWAGGSKKTKVSVFITLGSGVGGGVIIDGKIFDGVNGQGAELGHIHFDSNKIFRCGANHPGCFEAYANAASMVRDGRRIFGKKIRDPIDVHRLAEQKNKSALKYFEEYGKRLGIFSGYLLNVFNPDALLFGGALSGSWKFFEKGLKSEVKKYAFPSILKRAKVKRAALGNMAGVLGAAKLAFDEMA